MDEEVVTMAQKVARVQEAAETSDVKRYRGLPLRRRGNDHAGSGDTAAGVPYGTSVVVVDAVVRDKSGRRVEGLSHGDFEVREDGRRQMIVSFQEIRTGSAPIVSPGVEPARRGTVIVEGRLPSQLPSMTAIVFEQLGPEARRLARLATTAFLRCFGVAAIRRRIHTRPRPAPDRSVHE